MVVPPPGLSSTITVRPVAMRKASAKTRIVLSVPEPAPNGTTMRRLPSGATAAGGEEGGAGEDGASRQAITALPWMALTGAASARLDRR